MASKNMNPKYSTYNFIFDNYVIYFFIEKVQNWKCKINFFIDSKLASAPIWIIYEKKDCMQNLIFRGYNVVKIFYFSQKIHKNKQNFSLY